MTSNNPLIVQSDMTLLLEVDNPLFEEARDALASFAEIIKSPEHIHTYRVTPLSLWNAASARVDQETIINTLHKYSRFEVPDNLLVEIREQISRYGLLRIEPFDNETLMLTSEDPTLLTQLLHTETIKDLATIRKDERSLLFPTINRGLIKQALVKIGYPAIDLAGYRTGDTLEFTLSSATKKGEVFNLRDYQVNAIEAFYRGGSIYGGNGVIVLPCGAGKTMVGLGVMHKLKTQTLILTTSIVATRQWRDELLDKTDLPEDALGEYSGEIKQIRPITLASYQILTHRKSKGEDFSHFYLFNQRNWGLIIYDEVHLLPAQVFRFTASLQAVRRLGLTATLVREDGREDDVFSLIGPKCFDVPWKELEKRGWIAQAECYEIRVKIDSSLRLEYASAENRQRFRIASENPRKHRIAKHLIERHKGESILVIGQYLRQLEGIAAELNAPLITGKTPVHERERIYSEFREGRIGLIIVSSVANFALDLPEASVAIQISGRFGSRQEEAQRLGRILRPKMDGRSAMFYSLVTHSTEEQDFALHRQLFLTEQGYSYTILTEDRLSV
ncbi:TPA: helicase [bacterium]|nr:helicase [bacterium]